MTISTWVPQVNAGEGGAGEIANEAGGSQYAARTASTAGHPPRQRSGQMAPAVGVLPSRFSIPAQPEPGAMNLLHRFVSNRPIPSWHDFALMDLRQAVPPGQFTLNPGALDRMPAIRAGPNRAANFA